jgi:hypothetical protein
VYDIVSVYVHARVFVRVCLSMPEHIIKIVYHHIIPPSMLFYVLSGCPPENGTFPWRNEFLLSSYLRSNDQFVGRQWVLDELQQRLLDLRNSANAVFLVGAIGIWKSALMAHIVCMYKPGPGFYIRHHLLAYHVCQCHMPGLKSPARFIRNMAAMIARRIPQFYAIITTDPDVASILSRDRCELDPVACFNLGIRFPLSEIHSQVARLYILIDAMTNVVTTFDLF